MDIATILFALFAVLLASAIRGLTGFGLAIVLVPLLNVVIEPSQSVVLAILIGCLVGFLGLGSPWRNVDKRPALTISFFGILAAPLGFWLLLQLSSDVTKLAIGAIAIGSIFVVAMPKPTLPPPGFAPAAIVGILSGFLGSFAAMAGPPAIWYYARSGIAPDKIRDAMIVVFFIGLFVVAAMAFKAGLVEWEMLVLALISIPALVLGNSIGRSLMGIMPDRAWRVTVVGLVVCSTATSLARS